MSDSNKKCDNQPIAGDLGVENQLDLSQNSRDDEIFEFKKTLDELNAELCLEQEEKTNEPEQISPESVDEILKSLNDMPEKKTEIGVLKNSQTLDNKNLTETENVKKSEQPEVEEPKTKNPEIKEPKQTQCSKEIFENGQNGC